MNWFIHAFKNIFNYKGRARRAEFGWFILIGFLINIGIELISFVLEMGASLDYSTAGNILVGGSMMVFGILILLYAIASILVSLSLTARRLHDLGWSGWWQLIYLIPLVNIILLLVLLFKDGQRFTNKYGADPKSPQSENHKLNLPPQAEKIERLVE